MQKTAWLHRIRCTSLEREAVDALADRDGLEFPEALRQLVRRGAQVEGLWPTTDDAPPFQILTDTRAHYNAPHRDAAHNVVVTHFGETDEREVGA